ncbi:conserved hypothetical protein [Catalinimonas alkaloidigena]|uniref:DUF1704 domain-containing protein n=1 Tax=Catalinimonas alkaloidigena TaxID=1075417 RepID=A0A1G9QB79_9BACT|nr:tyrosine/phenylalanine carboxypeptidase domain-containing protein [Catalinimonas alkaloidigena]SDM08332.1 conserved hypothetical protein [Catalinimonas alkaloidigena]
MTEAITDPLLQEIAKCLAEGARCVRALPGGGQLYIDRPLPYLYVYRGGASPHDDEKAALDPLSELIRSEASWLITNGMSDPEVSQLVYTIAKPLADRFSAFLILEVWLDENNEHTFQVHGPQKKLPATVTTLEQALRDIRLPQLAFTVGQPTDDDRSPPDRTALLDKPTLKKLEGLYLGLSMRPFFIQPETGLPYPFLFRTLKEQVTQALRKTVFDFIRLQTQRKPVHFQSLGSRNLTDEVWEVDRQLVEISTAYEFLMLVTPVNTQEAWRSFRKSHYRKDPVLHYRLIPVDTDLLKRRLHNIYIERVEDPTLAFLFRDKRQEIDRMLTMLADRNSPNFLYGSLQIFGGVDDRLLTMAKGLMVALETQRTRQTKGTRLDAEAFRQRALREIEFFRSQHESVDAQVYVRDDMTGLMVSEGQLYIGKNYVIPAHRAEALIQHEVGTHVLTWYNGRAQPLQLLYSGVPGYEELQEGLAVLSEYLVGGLTVARLRVLAARVIAVDAMVRGASFPDTYRMLQVDYGFKPFNAFQITLRVYRGGGLTKDAVYLKGLIDLLAYLAAGNDLEPLLVGKIREDYLPFVQELLYRKVLQRVPLRPRYLDDPQAQERLARVKKGVTIFNLLDS